MQQALRDGNSAFTITVISDRRRGSVFVKLNTNLFHINYGCDNEGSNDGENGDCCLLRYDVV